MSFSLSKYLLSSLVISIVLIVMSASPLSAAGRVSIDTIGEYKQYMPMLTGTCQRALPSPGTDNYVSSDFQIIEEAVSGKYKVSSIKIGIPKGVDQKVGIIDVKGKKVHCGDLTSALRDAAPVIAKLVNESSDPTSAAAGILGSNFKTATSDVDAGGDIDGEGGGDKEEQPKTCTEQLESVGWIVCGPLMATTAVADFLFSMFEVMLITNPLSETSDNSAPYNTWKAFRDIANALLAVVFIVVIMSQISNIGISNYGIKKLLPRIMVMAVLVNSSFFLGMLAVDLVNILGKTLDNFLVSQVSSTMPGLGQAVTDLIATGVGTAVAGGAIAAIIGAAGVSTPALLGFAALLILPGVILMFAAWMAVFIRNLLVPVVVILAPLALVANILPNTQSIFEKWKKLATSILFLYPLVALYYGGLKLGVYITVMGQSGATPFGQIIAYALLFFGSAPIVLMSVKANSITGKMTGAIAGAVTKMTSPATKAARAAVDSRAALDRARANITPIGHRSFWRGGGAFNWGRERRQNMARSETSRKLALDQSQAVSKDDYEKRLLAGFNGHESSVNHEALSVAGGDRSEAATMLRQLSAKRRADKMSQAAGALQAAYATAQASGSVPNMDTWLEDRVKNAHNSGNDADRDAALNLMGQLGRSDSLRRMQKHSPSSKSSEFAAATQEALNSNASALVGKAPDMVKGPGPAFDNVTADQLLLFNPGTMEEYVNHLASGQAGSDASAYLDAALTKIQSETTLNAKADPASMKALRDAVNNANLGIATSVSTKINSNGTILPQKRTSSSRQQNPRQQNPRLRRP